MPTDLQFEAEQLNNGPFQLLKSSVIERVPILVKCRHNKMIYGRVKAFDKHFNLLMEDVVETWFAIPQHLKGTPGAQKIPQTRTISKLFLRGDGVILIVKNPKAD